MKREQKIDILIAALAKLIAEGRNDKNGYESAPKITFLSEKEVRFEEFPGKQLPTNKVYESNLLVGLLGEVFEYYNDDEEKYYLECLSEEDEQAAKDFENQGIYNPDSLSGHHIYHTIRLLGEFISETE